MPISTRLELARDTYGRALAAARERSTPVTWRRLVRAGENLRDALDEQSGMARGKATVLLVDDDEDARQAMQELLETQGLKVVTANDGLAALELLRRRRVRPRAIVLDLELPLMSGWELRRELLRDPAFAQIPVVVVSGSSEPPPPSVRSIMKPADPSALVDAISRAARSHQGIV